MRGQIFNVKYLQVSEIMRNFVMQNKERCNGKPRPNIFADCNRGEVKIKYKDIKIMSVNKITLFVGLNDKNTKQQEISTVNAYKVAQNLAASMFDGCTISEALGVYKHADGTIITESTLRIELLFVTVEQVKPYVRQLKSAFNQESIAVQYESINSELI